MTKVSNTQKKNISKKVLDPEKENQSSSLLNSFDDSLEKLFISALKKMYWAENQLILAIPKMIDSASDKKLKTSLANHLEETRQHASRIEQALELIEEDVLPEKCLACQGLVLSGEQCILSTLPGTKTRDIAIITSAVKVENFESTTYQGIIKIAEKLQINNVIELLTLNLNDELTAKEKLEALFN